ncbi:hypothetical protein V8E54_004513 [Elaphomyces granulatus]
MSICTRPVSICTRPVTNCKRPLTNCSNAAAKLYFSLDIRRYSDDSAPRRELSQRKLLNRDAASRAEPDVQALALMSVSWDMALGLDGRAECRQSGGTHIHEYE